MWRLGYTFKVRVIVGLAKNVKGNRDNNEYRGEEKRMG